MTASPSSRVQGSRPYADRNFFDRLHDEAAERLATVRELGSQRDLVAASLLADEHRASHRQIYRRRFPHAPALPGASTDTAEGIPRRMVAGAPYPTAPVPEVMPGAGEPSTSVLPGSLGAP